MRYHGFAEVGSMFCRPRLAKLNWDGETAPARVEQVWNYLAIKLRDFREALSRVNELYYDKHERTAYVKAVYLTLKEMVSEQGGKRRISTEADLKALLQGHQGDRSYQKGSPQLLKESVNTLETFTNKVKLVEERLRILRADFEEDILRHLTRYCSNYVSLGINDDDFYISLRSRTLSIRDIMNQFDMLMETLQLQSNNNPVPKELYSDHDFSLELSILVNCDIFPILRIPSDLIQKLENLCDVGQDWLRSDKVYLDEVQKEIEQTKAKLSDINRRAQMVKLQYANVYSTLKERQSAVDETEDHSEGVCKDLSELKSTKSRLDMEIAALQKTIKNTRDSMNGVSSASTSTSSKHAVISGTLLSRRSSNDDGTDCKLVSAAHCSYMSRLNHDVRQHTTKLESLLQKKNKVERKIEEKRSKLLKYESRESEMQHLGKRLRCAAKCKSKYLTETHSLRGRISMLEQLLRGRKRPGSSARSSQGGSKDGSEGGMTTDSGGGPGGSTSISGSGRTHVRRVLASKRQLTKLNMPFSGSHRSGHGKSKKSADLYKAFRIVKNGIGHDWKDLARSLPYSPAKELIEINNEITSIEYRNTGQLKEQAFQALLAWYGHCGRKASVQELCKTLRELNENRLADNIEKLVLKIDSASESSSTTTGQ